MKCHACKYEGEEKFWIIKMVQSLLFSDRIYFCPKCGTARITDKELEADRKARERE